MSKKVLISGSGGFIGGHMVQYILENTDWDIVCLDRYDIAGDVNRIVEVVEDMHFRYPQRVRMVFHDLKAPIGEFTSREIGSVDNIIHLAAGSHVDRSIRDPMSFVMDNVVGTTNLLLWAKEGGLKLGGKFLNFSTDEVFGPAPMDYFHKELDHHSPTNPYSATKSGQEAMGSAFFYTYHLPVITTHAMNNFGERQHPEKFIPQTIRRILEGRPVPIFSETDPDGKPRSAGSRFWIHAQNTASATLFILENGTPGEQYNIAGTDEQTTEEIATRISNIIGKPFIPEYIPVNIARPGHDRRYALDDSKLRAMGWKPEVDFEEAFKRTVKFTLDNPRWQ